MYLSHVPSKLLQNRSRVSLSMRVTLASCIVPNFLASSLRRGSAALRLIASRSACSWPGLTFPMTVNSVLAPDFSPLRFGYTFVVSISFAPLCEDLQSENDAHPPKRTSFPCTLVHL